MRDPIALPVAARRAPRAVAVALGVLAAAAGPGSAATGPEGVRLLASGPAGLRFAVEVPAPALERLPGVVGAPEAVRLALDGYEDRGAPGEPALPARVVMVAVPPAGEVRVRATASEPRVEEGVFLAPVPTLERGAGVEEARRVPSPEAYRADGADGAAPARLLGVSWMRNQRVARVLVTPADYRPASGRLVVPGRIEVEVDVEPTGVVGPPAESPDPFEGVYRGAVVNYEQGVSWRRPARGTALEAAAVADTASAFGGRAWIKIEVPRTGFYKVEHGQLRTHLRALGWPDAIRPDSLRLFAWPGYPVLPEATFCDGCDYREVAIGVVADTMFDAASEWIYFFALGGSDWADLYDPALPDTVFVNNPYDARSFCYLTVATAEQPVPGPPRRIGSLSAAVPVGGGGTTPATFPARRHHEVDAPSEHFPDLTPGRSTLFWEKWFWRSLNLGGIFGAGIEAPGIDTTQAARLRVRLWGIEAGGSCAGQSQPPNHLVDLDVGGRRVGRFGWNGTMGFTLDTPVSGLRSGGDDLRLEVATPGSCTGRIDHLAVAWFDLFYARRFVPADEALSFVSEPAAGDYLYRIGPFTRATPPRVFDVTDPLDPRELLDLSYEMAEGGHRLSFFASQGAARRRYRVIQGADIVRVANTGLSTASATSLVNLRSRLPGAEYVVIYYDGFKDAADSLAAWRQAHNGVMAMAVPVSAVYDQFSGGRTDPAALRNFLRAAFRNWQRRPVYVTLFGDASYDFKNLKGIAPAGFPGALVPSYENGYDDFVRRAYATDDWILNADPVNDADGVVPDFFGGRIPAMDVATALDVALNKILLYERTAPFGEHRNRVMLIADDQEQGSSIDRLYWTHLRQTTELDTVATPHHMDRVYVYLHAYPDGPSDTKPAAKADIKKNINEGGVALFNFIGHGSPFQMSDERVFLDSDVGTLVNAARLPLFVAASCDIGKYNDPTVQSLGERLVVRRGGGAIGVVSATELAFSGQNAALNRVIYREIFRRNVAGRYHVPVSEALLMGKSGSLNSQKYQLMGDAAFRLNLPRGWVSVQLLDSAGTDTLAALEQGRNVLFRGRILDSPGGQPLPLDGVASLLIEDSAPLVKAPPCPLSPGCGAFCRPPEPPDCGQPFFYFKAGPIYRGDVTVAGGSFEGRFVVPLEARRGGRAKVRAYVAGSVAGGGGFTDAAGSLRVGVAEGAAALDDREGPRISLAFLGGGTFVRPDAVLRVDLFDASGILITGHTPQNGIVVTVDDDPTTRVDITPTFRYAADSHRAGTATYPLPNLAPGPHRIRVSAADNLAVGLTAGAHRSSATIDFVVAESPPLRIRSAYLFPSPTRSRGPGAGGQFVIDAPGDSVNVLLRIYTVSGRLVREIQHFGGLGQVQIPWDGKDDIGQDLANGIYVFRAHVNARDPDGSSSPLQKAAVSGKFAIVNR